MWVTEDIDLVAPVASNHGFLRQNCHMKRIKFREVTLLASSHNNNNDGN